LMCICNTRVCIYIYVKFASASFCICFFQCHLPRLFYHQWRDVCAIADYAWRRLLKRRRSLLQALDWWGLRGPCTAIFTIYIYIFTHPARNNRLLFKISPELVS
jgi:hypothetical protein